MQRFFFHIYDDVASLDEEGEVLPDFAAARKEAIRGARSIAAEQVLKGRLNRSHWVDIADETGDVLGTVTFGDAIAVEG